MHAFDSALSLSATDLSNFLGCRHRTALDMAAALGVRTRAHINDPLLELLFARGLEHERTYVQSLREAGLRVVDFADVNTKGNLEYTLVAMRDGVDVIVQGALQDGRWFGHPDVIRRVETPSELGAWSYEIHDTKLAKETRAGTILQLGLYSEMLAGLQGTRPEWFHVVTPDRERPLRTYRVDDHAAYFRLVRAQMERLVDLGHEELASRHPPDPVSQCEICPWCLECRDRWRREDHLSLVAGIARTQRRELESNDVRTLASLAGLTWPFAFEPRHGSAEAWTRVAHQARLQLESRESPPPPRHELLPICERTGLCRLPAPSPGDVFLDLEGDPFAIDGGREYLFGIVTVDEDGKTSYRGWWAFDEKAEREAFEQVMDVIVERWREHPGMHVYHYAPYEPSAFKRLMGRHATRERELDAMLRAERFVDLYAVVRQGLRAGVERYSIKNLEVFYAFERKVELHDAGRCRALLEQGLELSCIDTVPAEIRDAVLGYNEDDCVSTLRLRDWLESLRAEVEASGTPVPRPMVKDGEAPEAVDERATRVAELRARLLEGIPEQRDERSAEQEARWVLAYLLDWHRREDKAGWWEYFRLLALPEEELLDESKAIAGLEFVERVEVVVGKSGKPTSRVIDRYAWPDQEMEISPGDELKLQTQEKLGDVVRVDRVARTIDIEKPKKQAEAHPSAVFAHKYISPKALEDSLFALGEHVASLGTLRSTGEGPFAAAMAMLRALPPRLSSGAFARRDDESLDDFVVRAGLELEDSFLAIQGPPGSGKTYTGARMIAQLVARGKKVGVVGPSHKVIENLLEAVVQRADQDGVGIRVARKGSGDDAGSGLRDAGEPPPDDSSRVPAARIPQHDTNESSLAALTSGEAQVLGGTAWMWARPEFANAVDVLVVDEAGQLSLANVLAVARAARSLVLLGDPQQLDQPRKGSHPEGAQVSALEHVLGGAKTIAREHGIFLPVTWRMAPGICAFTSELFYENRLESRPELAQQALRGVDGLDGSGLWIVDVQHDGNRNSSIEEVDVVRALVARLTSERARWVDQHGAERALTAADVLVVAPYNAHVNRLSEALAGTGVRVGTVDRFQGQGAPVVIYSMATSRPEDAPRGMEFLYSLNRLNVATSRARCAAIIVASHRLFEPECRTPRQMKLANALCRFREMARSLV